jgi:4-hydroxythreonine-4-phosphate dehydrogenase
MASKVRILITTGDPDGIGWEVTCKALDALGPKPGVQFAVYRHPTNMKPGLGRKFQVKSIASAEAAILEPFESRTLFEIQTSQSPALCVEEAAHLCLRGAFQGLVTAPLSKSTILAAGLKDIGHTEILSRITRRPDLFMGFMGPKFNIVLATGHRALKDAIESLSPTILNKAISAAEELRACLPAARRQKPLALIGVNPHAGEGGLLGDEENLFRDWLKSSSAGRKIIGPMVPDVAFQKKNWSLYSVYICTYHDQGLIPFKMVHGFEHGVHLTLGLPFVRTSVDHGTAKDIFNRNKAESGSMREALMTAIRLCRERHK